MCCAVQVLLLTDPGTNYSFQIFLQIRKILSLGKMQHLLYFLTRSLTTIPAENIHTNFYCLYWQPERVLLPPSAPLPKERKTNNHFLVKIHVNVSARSNTSPGASVAHSMHTHILLQKSSELAQPLLASWTVRLAQQSSSSLDED